MINIPIQPGVLADSAEIESVRSFLQSLPFPNGRSCEAEFVLRGGKVLVSIQVPNALGSGTCNQAFDVAPDPREAIRGWLFEHFTRRKQVLERSIQECTGLVDALGGHVLTA